MKRIVTISLMTLALTTQVACQAGAASDRFSSSATWQATFSRPVVSEKLRSLAGDIGDAGAPGTSLHVVSAGSSRRAGNSSASTPGRWGPRPRDGRSRKPV